MFQTCYKCGSVSKGTCVSLSEFKCLGFGYAANTDVNAALNIQALGMLSLGVGRKTLFHRTTGAKLGEGTILQDICSCKYLPNHL